MDRSDVSIVAVELSGHRPAKTMVLRGDNFGSPKMQPIQPRPIKQIRVNAQWENASNGVYHNGSLAQMPPPRLDSHNHSTYPSSTHFPPPPSSSSPVSGSEYSTDTRDEEQRSQSVGTSHSDTKLPNESVSVVGVEQPSSETPPPRPLTASPIVDVDVVPPLTKIHFSCYQSHRSFMVSKNAYYSVPCMTCLKADQQVRWRCTFCYLRVCGDCAKGISSCKDRSLMEFLENLVQNLEDS